MDNIDLIIVSKILPLDELTEIAVWLLGKKAVVYLCIRDKAKPKPNPKVGGESEKPVIGFYISRKAENDAERENERLMYTIDGNDVVAMIDNDDVDIYDRGKERLGVVKSSPAEVVGWIFKVTQAMEVKK